MLNTDYSAAILPIRSQDPNNRRFGTGFIIKHDAQYSYLLTCRHVIEDVGGAAQIQINDHTAELIVQGESQGIDLALIKCPLLSLPSLQLSESEPSNKIFSTCGYAVHDPKGGSLAKRQLQGNLGRNIDLYFAQTNKTITAWDIHIAADDYFSNLQAGYSGSPLYDDLGKVFAVMIQKRGDKNGHALAISNLKQLASAIYNDCLTPVAEISSHTDIEKRIKKLKMKLMKLNKDDDLKLLITPIKNHFKKISSANDNQNDDNENDEFMFEIIEEFLNEPENERDNDEFISFCNDNLTGLKKVTDNINYKLLAQRLEYGSISLFIGLDLASQSAENYPNTEQLTPKLVEDITAKVNGNLSEVCEYLQINSDYGRDTLVRNLQKLYKNSHDHSQPNLYDLLAKIDTPLVLIVAAYDDCLEQSFKQQHKKFVCIDSLIDPNQIKNINLQLHYSDQDQAETCTLEALSEKQIIENGYSLIYKLRGHYTDPHKESLLLSEQDYLSFVKTIDSRIPAYITNKLSERGLWFLGHLPETWENRMLIRFIRDKRDPFSRLEPPIAIHKNPAEFAKFFWKNQHIDTHNLALSDFISGINAVEK